MELTAYSFKTLEILLFAWCSITTLYMLVYAVLGLFYKQRKSKYEKYKINEAPRIAVIIPAYKEDAVILKTVQSALDQNYQVGKFQVIVVADQLKDETLWKLNLMEIKLVKVAFEKSTKAKAIKAALNSMSSNFDLVVILDADNIIHSNFLSLMAEEYKMGYSAIQGHRTAKNLNTPYALLDAISEEINNTIFCKGQRYLGMSSRLTGSGMAFKYELFKDLMESINAVGGFDKELELLLIQHEAQIQYVDNALIYDEKVSKSEVLTNQRARWISSQFHFMKKYFPSSIKELVMNRNVDYFNKAFQLIIPPRVFTVLLIVFGILISVLNPQFDFNFYWVVLFISYMMVFITAFPKKHLNKALLSLIIVLPNSMLKIIYSIPQLFKANKAFIHTPHEI